MAATRAIPKPNAKPSGSASFRKRGSAELAVKKAGLLGRRKACSTCGDMSHQPESGNCTRSVIAWGKPANSRATTVALAIA